ncbi:MAG: hydrolase [Patescibacteria group bacterium]
MQNNETKTSPINTDPEECHCLYFEESAWEDKTLDWSGRQFLRMTYRNWLYKPREDVGNKIIQGYEEIARRGYGVIPYGFVLFQNGIFKGEILLEIKKGDVDDEQVKTFLGGVHTKTYIGPYKDLPLVAKTFPFRPLNIYALYFSCAVCTPNPDKQKTVLVAEKPFY